jgi:SAM-dependent methyltransferase
MSRSHITDFGRPDPWERGNIRKAYIFRNTPWRTCRSERLPDIRAWLRYWAEDTLFWFGKTCSIFKLELSEAAVARVSRIARKRGYAYYEFKEPDSEKLPYADGTFDLIIMSHVLEHVHNHREMLREIARCLRPRSSLAFLVGPLDDWRN